MRAPAAMIFDAEGVIIDTEPLWDVAQFRLLARRGHTYDRERVKHLLTGRDARAAVAALAQAHGLPDDPDDLRAERDTIMASLLSRGVPYVPGFLRCTRALRAAIPAAVATSMDPALLALPAVETALENLFPGQVHAVARAGVRSKPAPDIFLLAARRLGAEPAACVVVEDSPAGIRGAGAAGMPCLALATTHAPARLTDADHVFASWPELSDWWTSTFGDPGDVSSARTRP